MNPICDKPGCGAPAVHAESFDDGSRYSWCAGCAADIRRQVAEVVDMVRAATAIEAVAVRVRSARDN